jgi:hypothetical protein
MVAVISFVCSVGNLPLAAVLWSGGISFGGVVAFLFADLIVLPILNIYTSCLGARYEPSTRRQGNSPHQVEKGNTSLVLVLNVQFITRIEHRRGRYSFWSIRYPSSKQEARLLFLRVVFSAFLKISAETLNGQALES